VRLSAGRVARNTERLITMSGLRVGLVDVDGHASKKKWGSVVYPNLALCKLSRWHKMRGDVVEWADSFTHYDVVYMAKVFSFTADAGYCYNADKVIKGGTGYDVHSHLPDEVDRMQPDYSIYPHVPSDTAYGFLTRGCPNRCPWCVVPRKEGKIRPYMDVEQIAIEGRDNLVLMDNNILAAGDYAHEQLDKIARLGYHVDFNQALDARLVTDEFAQQLARVRWIHSRIRFGCDTQQQIAECERAMELLHDHGFKGEFFLYTMIGGKNDFGECHERINHWRERLLEFRRTKRGNAVYAYAQPYRDPMTADHTIPLWQLDMARWCNKRMIWVTVPFGEFEPRKGFKCERYFDRGRG